MMHDVQALHKYEIPDMKPCPFCGGPAKVRSYGGWGEFDKDEEYKFGTPFAVGCAGDVADCGIQPTTHGYLTPQTAADVWNRRR